MAQIADYVPIDWVDNVTVVDESKMDHIEGAIDRVTDQGNASETRITTLEGRPITPTVVNGKWIKGVGGAMVWSDIAITDVANLQTTLNGKQDSSGKGVANGYASLDSGGKVPSAQLPVSIDLRWAGTYAAATAYKEGDVVIHNGVSYLALRPSTGETPTPWGAGGGGGGTLTGLSNYLAADVALTTSNQYYQGPALSLAAGTWQLVGNVVVTRAGNAGFLTAKLWDGTTLISAAEIHSSGVSSGQSLLMSIAGQITLAATTSIKIDVAANAAGHIMRSAAQTPTAPPGNVSYLTAVKIG